MHDLTIIEDEVNGNSRPRAVPRPLHITLLAACLTMLTKCLPYGHKTAQ